MRVSVVSNLYPPVIRGGAEVSTQLLVDGLEQLGHSVQVTTLWHGGADASHGTASVPIRLHRPYDTWAEGSDPSIFAKCLWHTAELVGERLPQLRHEIRAYQPDVVLTQNLTGFGRTCPGEIRGAIGAGVPIIHTLRDYGLICVRNACYHSEINSCRSSIPCFVRRTTSKFSTGFFDGVVGISQSILEFHRERGLFHGLPSVVIPNSPPVSSPKSSRTGTAIGFLGRISEEKGVFDLVQAYRMARRRNSNLPTLLIAGDGETDELARLRRAIEGHSINYLGRVHREDFLPQLGLLVVPSRWREPFGRVVIEAAAHKVPVLGAAIGGIPEALQMVIDDSRQLDRALYRPGDIRQLANRLIEFCQNGLSPTNPSSRTNIDVALDYLRFIDGFSETAVGKS